MRWWRKGRGRLALKAGGCGPAPSLWAGPLTVLLWVRRACGTGRGSRRVAFRARWRGGVKPVFPRLSAIRLAGRRVPGCDATPLPPRLRRDFRLLRSVEEPGKARCGVWRGVRAPCLLRPASLVDWERWRCPDFKLWLLHRFCFRASWPGTVVSTLLHASWIAP